MNTHEQLREEYTERFLEEKLENSYKQGYKDVISLNKDQFELYSKENKFDWNEENKKISEQWWSFWNYMGTPLRDNIENFWLSKLDAYADAKLAKVAEEIEKIELNYKADTSPALYDGVFHMSQSVTVKKAASLVREAMSKNK